MSRSLSSTARTLPDIECGYCSGTAGGDLVLLGRLESPDRSETMQP
jgi:hypothetical protein